MKGALLELSARGGEDVFLIGNPQFSYFKSVHRRHTNFARFECQQIFQGAPGFGKKITVTLDKKGDLLTNTLLEIRLPATGNGGVSWINSPGNFIIREVVMRIGGEVISRVSGEYMDLYYRYYLQFGHYLNYTSMVKRISGYASNSLTDQQLLYVFLPFWFSKELSQALPVISLGYHDITIEIEFRPLSECLFNGNDKSTIGITDLEMSQVYLWTDFIYLDKWERQMFLNREELDYLIEQVQENEFSLATGEVNKTFELVFNLPVKEMIWVYRDYYWENRNRWDYFLCHDTVTNRDLAPIDQVSIQFNGLDRTYKRTAEYYRLVQPILHHNSCTNDFVYVYSFAHQADSIQPSGAVNFSQIDDARLAVQFFPYITSGRVKVWAVNYNILKIKNGMAGVSYSS